MKLLLVTASVVMVAASVDVAATADGVSDEARIEQLLHQPQQQIHQPPPKAAPSRAAAKPAADPAAALIGQKVHVRTVDRGLYAGILQSVDAGNIVLRIDLPKQALSYTLPRSGVAELKIAETTP